MKHSARLTAILAFGAALAAAGDRKPLPNQAGNDNIELEGTVVLDRADVMQVIGADPGEHYVVVRIKATPKTDEALFVSPGDFTLISRKDGDREEALEPGEIAGKGALVIKQDHRGRDWAQQTNRPGWIGVGGMQRSPGQKPKDDSKDTSKDDPKMTSSESGSGNGEAPKDGAAEANPLLDTLKAKLLPSVETKKSVEGLLYFSLDAQKIKAKDLSLLYKGSGGRLVMDFR